MKMLNILKSTFSDRLKEALRLKHISQKELSDRTGISKSNITHYINGRNMPKREYLLNIANVLEVNFMWLLGHDAPIDPPSKQKISTEQIIETMRVYYGEGAGRMITNYLMLNEYGQLKVADYIQTLLMDSKYRSEI